MANKKICGVTQHFGSSSTDASPVALPLKKCSRRYRSAPAVNGAGRRSHAAKVRLPSRILAGRHEFGRGKPMAPLPAG